MAEETIIKVEYSSKDTTLKAEDVSATPDGVFFLHCSAKYRSDSAMIFCATLGDVVKEFQKFIKKYKINQANLSYAYLFILPDKIHYANLIINDADGSVSVIPTTPETSVSLDEPHHRTNFMKRIFGQ